MIGRETKQSTGKNLKSKRNRTSAQGGFSLINATRPVTTNKRLRADLELYLTTVQWIWARIISPLNKIDNWFIMFDNRWYTRILEQSFNYSSFCYIHKNISCFACKSNNQLLRLSDFPDWIPVLYYYDCHKPSAEYLSTQRYISYCELILCFIYFPIALSLVRTLPRTAIEHRVTDHQLLPRQAAGYPPHPFFLSATVLICHCQLLLLGFCCDSWFNLFQHLLYPSNICYHWWSCFLVLMMWQWLWECKV